MTFSIVARDPSTGAFGVATATGGPCVGALVPNAASGIGAIATQGDTNPYFAYDGLMLLGRGETAEDVVETVVAADAGRGGRQVIAIGQSGEPAAFTGQSVEAVSGSVIGNDFAVAGNMLAAGGVLETMAEAFRSTGGQLEDRLIAAMRAGAVAGGDRRGTRSAALLVYSTQAYPDLDCRIDFSEDPIVDLANLLERCRDGDYARFLADRPRRDLVSD